MINTNYSAITTPLLAKQDEKVEPIFDQEVVIDGWKDKLGNIVLRIFRITLGIFKLFGSAMIAPFKRKPDSHKSYCFTQQYNNSCHISPLKNLQILDKLRENNFDLAKADFFSRREWLGENQQMLSIWHHLISEIITENGKVDYPDAYKFMMEGFNKAPIFPHYYDENHKFPFDGLKGLVEFSEVPYFFIDLDDLTNVSFRIFGQEIKISDMFSKEDLGLAMGIVKERGGEVKIYDRTAHQYVPITNLGYITLEAKGDGFAVVVDQEKVSATDRERYALPLPGHTPFMTKSKSGMGYEMIAVDHDLGGGLQVGEHTYAVFQWSLLKMLFILNGVDENNNDITESHQLWPVFQDFKRLMAKDSENVWHPDKNSKEMILQYHLAKLFKENSDLCAKALATVDTVSDNWKNYKKLCAGNFYNQKGEKMNEELFQEYLLGKEQALAYYFMQNVRLLWYSAINAEVPIKCLELGLPESLGPLFHEFLKSRINENVTVKLNNGETTKTSFIEAWQEILEELKTRTGDRKDFMSFDDHGWVVSFDEEVINLQNQSKGIHDRSLLKKLGIAGIESWLSSDLNLWYSKRTDLKERKVTVVATDSL
ncbi:MAG: hypothetical protein H7A37_03290 [Chlamydiales bacterium]|nr:hypothetical protein [Chlamydiia bacterium]MCP5507311.1 hypothetical protein [Chlamydiales bacterium]